jgi:uncharacterized protein involved in response to NO
MNTQTPLAQIVESRNRPPDGRSAWQVFSAAPHRMMFFAGFAQLILTVSWWAAELAGRYSGLWQPLPLPVAATWTHAFLMVYGIFPFFIFGFLMTTYPRWMRTDAVPARRYVPAFLLLAAGMLLFYLGMASQRWLLAAGIALFLAGWGVALYALLRSYLAAQVEDTRYETLFNFNLVAGWTGAALFLGAVLSEHWLLAHYAIQIGLWVFLLPLLVGVCHRMLPFFTGAVLKDYEVYRPQWVLPLVLACGIAHAALSMQALWAWRLLPDVALMAMAFHLSYRWQFRRSLQDRLVAVLHIAFLWLGIALALYNLQSFWLAWQGELILGKAPLHALTIGFMVSLVVGMASRVSLGHSGQMLAADGLTWLVFWGISAVAALRMAAELQALSALGGYFNLAAALLWLALLAAWGWRYMPLFLRPRPDGKLD